MNQDSPVAADDAATTSADRHRSDDAPRSTGSSEGGEGADSAVIGRRGSLDRNRRPQAPPQPRGPRTQPQRLRHGRRCGRHQDPGRLFGRSIGNLPARRATTDPPRLLVPGPHVRLARHPRPTRPPRATRPPSQVRPPGPARPPGLERPRPIRHRPSAPTSVDGDSASPTGAPKRRRRRGGRGRGGGGGGARAGTTASPSNGQGRASDDESADRTPGESRTRTPGEPHRTPGVPPRTARHVRRKAAPPVRHRRRGG